MEIYEGTYKFSSNVKLIVDGTFIADGSSSNRITFDKSGSSKWYGIKLNDSSDDDCSITYCDIKNAKQAIYGVTANPDVENCSFESCDRGIYLYYPDSPNNDIYNNTFNSGLYGIAVQSGDIEIRNNDISECIWFGISLSSSDSHIDDNNVYDNTQHGISISYCDPTLTGNLIYDNGYYGVYCYNYSDPDFYISGQSNNVVAYNSYHGIWIDNKSLPYLSGYPYSNSFYDNGAWYKEVYSLQSSSVDARFNWWGEYPPDPGRIYGNVNQTYPSYVDWNPDPHGLSKPLANGSESQPADQTNAQILPSNDEAHKIFYEGYLLEADFKYDESLNNYKTVIAGYPESFEAMMALSRIRKCLKRSDRLKEYAPYLSSLYELNKDRLLGAQVLLMQIPIFIRNKSIDKALENCATIIKAFPESDVAQGALHHTWLIQFNNMEDSIAAKTTMDQYGAKYPNDENHIFMMIAMDEITPEQAKELMPKESISQDSNDDVQPVTFELSDNYPNPFNPETTIQIGLPEDSDVKLQVFNIRGQVVATPFEGNLPAGSHMVNFNASNLSSGTYFYKITAGNFTDVKRMVLVK